MVISPHWILVKAVNFDGYLLGFQWDGAGIASSQLKTCSVAMFILSVMNHWLSLKKAVFVAAHANICKSFAKGKLPYSGLHRPFNTSLARALNLFLLMVAMLLSAINGTIFLVGIAASSFTPLFEQVTLIIWSCRVRIKEPYGFNRVIAL